MKLVEFLKENKVADAEKIASLIEQNYSVFYINERTLYRTSKTLQAALLRLLGFEFHSWKFDGRNVHFYFGNKQAIIKALIEYENNKIRVDPKALVQEFEQLKANIKGMLND